MAETRITLQAADYWRLRALSNDVHAIEIEAAQAAARFKARIAEAQQKSNALLTDLGKVHGFDLTKPYRWDDATCELIEVQP